MQRPQGPALQGAILDEARRLLLAEGPAALSTRRIARAVGCTATSIYLHYASKDALLHALVEEGFELLHERLERALVAASAAGASGLERLRALGQAYVRFAQEQAAYYEVMFRLAPEPLAGFPNESYVRARRGLELIAATVREARADHELEPGCALTHATLLWSSLHGCLALLANRRIDQRLEADLLLEQAVDQACRIHTRPALAQRTSA